MSPQIVRGVIGGVGAVRLDGPGYPRAAAAVVFAQALPDGVVLAIDDSTSYAQWLRQRPDAGSATGA